MKLERVMMSGVAMAAGALPGAALADGPNGTSWNGDECYTPDQCDPVWVEDCVCVSPTSPECVDWSCTQYDGNGDCVDYACVEWSEAGCDEEYCSGYSDWDCPAGSEYDPSCMETWS